MISASKTYFKTRICQNHKGNLKLLTTMNRNTAFECSECPNKIFRVKCQEASQKMKRLII